MKNLIHPADPESRTQLRLLLQLAREMAASLFTLVCIFGMVGAILFAALVR